MRKTSALALTLLSLPGPNFAVISIHAMQRDMPRGIPMSSILFAVSLTAEGAPAIGTEGVGR